MYFACGKGVNWEEGQEGAVLWVESCPLPDMLKS